MKLKVTVIILALHLLVAKITAQTLPRPDHIVILMMENYGYPDIIGSADAPHINALVSDPNAALFTQSYGITHPSQPNYINLYSGSSQGVTNDNSPSGTPYTTCNLGASLIDSGYTFKGYSEDLPAVGDLVFTSGNYVRRHCPWTNWQATSGLNSVDSSVHQPYTSFPSSSNYDSLPTVSFVIPNLADDMHNPTFPTFNYKSIAISNGDTWFYNHLNDYINWAKTHNSLFILTFDEDDGHLIGGVQTGTNQITTIMVGQMVQGGSYPEYINHYSVLRTIEDMYDLPYCGNSDTAHTITSCWNPTTTGIIEKAKISESLLVFPNPTQNNFTLDFVSAQAQTVEIKICNLLSQPVLTTVDEVQEGKNSINLSTTNLPAGSYIISVTSNQQCITKKIIVQ